MHAVNLESTDIEGGAGQFAVSNTGTLIYATGGVGAMVSSRLTWVDRQGKAEPLETAPAAPFVGFRLSPDGQKDRRGSEARRDQPRDGHLDLRHCSRRADSIDGRRRQLSRVVTRRTARRVRGAQPAHDRRRRRHTGTDRRERRAFPIVMVGARRTCSSSWNSPRAGDSGPST